MPGRFSVPALGAILRYCRQDRRVFLLSLLVLWRPRQWWPQCARQVMHWRVSLIWPGRVAKDRRVAHQQPPSQRVTSRKGKRTPLRWLAVRQKIEVRWDIVLAELRRGHLRDSGSRTLTAWCMVFQVARRDGYAGGGKRLADELLLCESAVACLFRNSLGSTHPQSEAEGSRTIGKHSGVGCNGDRMSS